MPDVYQMQGTEEESAAFRKVFGIEELDERQQTLMYGTCFGAFLLGYRRAKAEEKQKENTQDARELQTTRELLAKELNYPAEWDTAAYPTLESAAIEAIATLTAERDHAQHDLEESRKPSVSRKELADRLSYTTDYKAFPSLEDVALSALKSRESPGFYTMDQMRDFAQGMITTRSYVVIESMERKIREWHETAITLDQKNIPGGHVYRKALEELRTIAENAKSLGNKPFQARAGDWAKKCFGLRMATDPRERNQRFAEEAIELVQACGMTKREALGAVEYVFGRPVGEKRQEVGGVYTTLALLCHVQGIDMVGYGEKDLMEINAPEKTESIAKKRHTKPDFAIFPL